MDLVIFDIFDLDSRIKPLQPALCHRCLLLGFLGNNLVHQQSEELTALYVVSLNQKRPSSTYKAFKLKVKIIES